MENLPRLTPCLVGTGTVTHPRDMVRALETLEGFAFTYTVDGQLLDTGRAALVKLMADHESSTILVNGCLFLNVMSFRYLTFETDESGSCKFELFGDGFQLRLEPTDDADSRVEERGVMHLLEGEAFGSGSFVVHDDEDEEEQ